MSINILKVTGPVISLDTGSNKNIKDIKILLKRNWNFPKHIFNKNIERILKK